MSSLTAEHTRYESNSYFSQGVGGLFKTKPAMIQNAHQVPATVCVRLLLLAYSSTYYTRDICSNCNFVGRKKFWNKHKGHLRVMIYDYFNLDFIMHTAENTNVWRPIWNRLMVNNLTSTMSKMQMPKMV